MRPAIAWAICLLVTPAAASEVVLTGLEPGKTVYLRVEVTAGGVATITTLPSRDVGGGGSTPRDPPPNDPTDLTGLAKIAADSAVGINRPTEAAALAATYSAIAGELRSGNLAAADAKERTTTAVDTVLGVMRAKDRWRGWRESMSAEMRTMGIRTGDDLAAAYEALAAGLNASAGDSNAALDVAVIIKLVLAIITKNPAAITAAILELVQSLRP